MKKKKKTEQNKTTCHFSTKSLSNKLWQVWLVLFISIKGPPRHHYYTDVYFVFFPDVGIFYFLAGLKKKKKKRKKVILKQYTPAPCFACFPYQTIHDTAATRQVIQPGETS